jgi:hypothetical protein
MQDDIHPRIRDRRIIGKMQKRILIFGLIGALLLILGIIITISLFPEGRYDASLISPPETSSDVMKKLSDKFENRKIPHKLKKGVIYYPQEYKKIALELYDEILSSYVDDLRTKYTHNEDKEYFIELLEKENIPYRRKKYHPEGDEWILWRIKDDDKVKDIQLKVLDRMGFTKQPARWTFDSKKERSLFVAMLKKENIPFKIGEEKIGQRRMLFIEYNWKDDKKIQRLLKAGKHRDGKQN